jgi:predicted  nucleic acid-binding Zn-ribbon protein
MAEETFPLEEFKGLLTTFLKNNLDIYKQFEADLDMCKTEYDIINLFKRHNDDVYEELGGYTSEIIYLRDEVSDLEDEVRDLEYEKDELESEIKYVRLNFGDTLNDVYKIAAFKEYYDEYTPWEIEELLKNGKNLLKNANK